MAMNRLFLTIGLIALAGCARGPKPQPQNQPQSVSRPALDQSGEPVGQGGAQTAVAAPNEQPDTETPPDPESVIAPAPRLAIPAGTQVGVRLEQTLDTKRNRPGDRFEATLISPIQVNGNVIVPRGTTFEGHVTYARPSGRFRGRAELGVELDSFRLNGAFYRIATAPDIRISKGHRKRNWVLIGGGSGLGATFGAVAGGGVGAAIGAGAGAGVGTVGALFTGRKNVSFPVETLLTFRLRTDVTLNGRQPG
jgi:hypothetical protein